MFRVTIGEQTQGSMLRPASYCGVTDFKPSYGLLSMDGVLPLAKSLDTLGSSHIHQPICSCSGNHGTSYCRVENFVLGAPEPMPEVEPPMQTAFRNALSALRTAGIPPIPDIAWKMLAKTRGERTRR